MKCSEVIDILSAHRRELSELWVRSLYVFGSVARDQAGDHSDVDLLVEFDRPVGLFHFSRVRRRLEEVLGCRVDLTTRAALRDEFKADILREAVHAA